jgi:hypothetical protein
MEEETKAIWLIIEAQVQCCRSRGISCIPRQKTLQHYAYNKKILNEDYSISDRQTMKISSIPLVLMERFCSVPFSTVFDVSRGNRQNLWRHSRRRSRRRRLKAKLGLTLRADHKRSPSTGQSAPFSPSRPGHYKFILMFEIFHHVLLAY